MFTHSLYRSVFREKAELQSHHPGIGTTNGAKPLRTGLLASLRTGLPSGFSIQGGCAEGPESAI